jgi:fumarate reductase subunit C
MIRSAGSVPSPWPARLDLLQGASGLLLALFMVLHLTFVSSILLGKDAFWSVARAFEGYFLLGRPYPLLVSLLVVAVLALILVHAALALRKLPAGWHQYQAFRSHVRAMHHTDTHLWWVQVITGFAMFFLAPVHLYALLVGPGRIDPFGSADLVWSDRAWPMLLLLLICVEVHGMVGLYRLALKWGWPSFGDPLRTRTLLRRALWGLILFFILSGGLSLSTFMRIGIAHAPQAGELYTPTWMRGQP